MEEGIIRKVREDLGRDDDIKMMDVIEEEGELGGRVEVGWESGK